MASAFCHRTEVCAHLSAERRASGHQIRSPAGFAELVRTKLRGDGCPRTSDVRASALAVSIAVPVAGAARPAGSPCKDQASGPYPCTAGGGSAPEVEHGGDDGAV